MSSGILKIDDHEVQKPTLLVKC